MTGDGDTSVEMDSNQRFNMGEDGRKEYFGVYRYCGRPLVETRDGFLVCRQCRQAPVNCDCFPV